jgi:hypothetical protein
MTAALVLPAVGADPAAAVGERPFMASTDESLASWVSVTPFEPMAGGTCHTRSG